MKFISVFILICNLYFISGSNSFDPVKKYENENNQDYVIFSTDELITEEPVGFTDIDIDIGRGNDNDIGDDKEDTMIADDGKVFSHEETTETFNSQNTIVQGSSSTYGLNKDNNFATETSSVNTDGTQFVSSAYEDYVTNSYGTPTSTTPYPFITPEYILPHDSENVVDETTKTTTTETYTITSTTETEITVSKNNSDAEEAKNSKVYKISDQIRGVLEKYKESGEVIVPGVPLPDPMPMAEIKQRMSMINMVFKNMTVHGLSNFTVQHINTDLEKMQVYIQLHMKKVFILGNYSMTSFVSKAAGPFNVTMYNVITEGAAALKYNSNGELEASDTDMDMSFRDIDLDFKNLGFMLTVFQGIVGAVGSILFEAIKPPILKEINTSMRDDINMKIRTISTGVKTNSSVNPVDQAIYAGRRYIVNNGYDPYYLANYSRTVGIFVATVRDFKLSGVSRFSKVGEVSLSMDNGTIEAGIHLATDKLFGNLKWDLRIFKKQYGGGKASFAIDHIQIRAIVKQSLDLRNRLELTDLDFYVGKLKLLTDREDSDDVIMEIVVNNLPPIIKHLIVDSIEDPVKDFVQKILNEIDVESIVNDQLPNIDKLGV